VDEHQSLMRMSASAGAHEHNCYIAETTDVLPLPQAA
jgi:hypothetical protein